MAAPSDRQSSTAEDRVLPRPRWLLFGAFLAAAGIVLFVVALRIQTITPVVGIIVTAVLYAAMLLTRLLARNPRTQNLVLAWLMGVMAAGLFALFLIILIIEVNRLSA
ncbi:hypothetical protein [Herbiconiux sp. VKM Ac-2851]|uniref:hypothetical protein n=1 Tax=Herbiconiux sp. VKM Ac-2851 TaxID=2739025 RepID=UPI001564420E|nr:hypothetical protein [Herbiconiux sp. VKM Ac-2851]NQX37165.1 hypothetical protein [Herbiconiux sp. VKM Ac-2851]